MNFDHKVELNFLKLSIYKLDNLTNPLKLNSSSYLYCPIARKSINVDTLIPKHYTFPERHWTLSWTKLPQTSPLWPSNWLPRKSWVLPHDSPLLFSPIGSKFPSAPIPGKFAICAVPTISGYFFVNQPWLWSYSSIIPHFVLIPFWGRLILTCCWVSAGAKKTKIRYCVHELYTHRCSPPRVAKKLSSGGPAARLPAVLCHSTQPPVVLRDAPLWRQRKVAWARRKFLRFTSIDRFFYLELAKSQSRKRTDILFNPRVLLSAALSATHKMMSGSGA